MNAERRSARTSGRSAAIAASVGVHAVVLLFLVWRLGDAPGVADTPVMSVELATPPYAALRPLPQLARAREPAVKPRAPAARPISPNRVDPPTIAPSGPVLSRPEADSAGVQRALRGLAGCRHADLARLTPDERRHCEARELAAAERLKNGPAAKLNFDLNGRYAENPEAYLNRRPKNGCKARVGGDIAPMGEQGGAGGVTCALSF